jgi:hypothetical protein
MYQPLTGCVGELFGTLDIQHPPGDLILDVRNGAVSPEKKRQVAATRCAVRVLHE